MKFYLTFASSHPIGNHWIEVEAPDYDCAREVIVETFGTKWAFMYTEETFNRSYFPAGKVGRTLEYN